MINCLICKFGYKNYNSFSAHLKIHKITVKKYYDKFLIKDKKEKICNNSNCNKKVKFYGLKSGYYKFCSYSCKSKDYIEKNGTIFRDKNFIINSGIKRRGVSTYLKGKTYEELYGKEKADKLKKERSKKLSNRIVSVETGRKISKTKLENKYIVTEETRNKLSLISLGLKRSDETKRKQRIKAIEQLNKKLRKNFVPNYNKKACEYFNKLMIETKTQIQHAENGGEYHIKELGYFLDGYDKDNNIVYEYDERNKMSNNKIKEKHLKRQLEIEKFLKCKFVRILEK